MVKLIMDHLPHCISFREEDETEQGKTCELSIASGPFAAFLPQTRVDLVVKLSLAMRRNALPCTQP